MKTPSQPPRPGVRRKVFNTCLNNTEEIQRFRTAVEAIVICGLAAEVEREGQGSFIQLYATRRVRTTKGE
jgi:hypothetical protein